MLNPPVSPHQGATFNLVEVERELRSEPAYQRSGHAARTLVRLPDLRMVVIAMRAGGRIAEHVADESASIHTLSGSIQLRLPDRTVELVQGQVLVLEPGVRHDVVASEDSSFLLTLGWPSESSANDHS